MRFIKQKNTKKRQIGGDKVNTWFECILNPDKKTFLSFHFCVPLNLTSHTSEPQTPPWISGYTTSSQSTSPVYLLSNNITFSLTPLPDTHISLTSSKFPATSLILLHAIAIITVIHILFPQHPLPCLNSLTSPHSNTLSSFYPFLFSPYSVVTLKTLLSSTFLQRTQFNHHPFYSFSPFYFLCSLNLLSQSSPPYVFLTSLSSTFPSTPYHCFSFLPVSPYHPSPSYRQQ